MDGPSGENMSWNLASVGHCVEAVEVDVEDVLDEVMEKLIDKELEDPEEHMDLEGLQEDEF